MLNHNVNVISVSQLSFYLKNVLDNDVVLNNLLVKGEISNLKYHPSGHVYFSLKDQDSVVKCVMFSSYASKLTVTLKEGEKIIVNGSLSLYPASGSYQIYVKGLEKDGIGNLYLEFEKLKKELEQKGLFSPLHKKKLKEFPFTIGVISGKTGAGLRDILTIIKRRWPIAEIIVFPCLVQGNGASESIIRALDEASKFNLDLTILARGGGSQEDLWCFNDEKLAYAIYNYKTPIITGIGHEIDFTIADFVSDCRAPTPSGAAEMSTPDIEEVKTLIKNYNEIIKHSSKKLVMDKRNILLDYESYLTKEYFDKLLENKRETLKDRKEQLRISYLNFSKFYKGEIVDLNKTLKVEYSHYLANVRNILSSEIKILDNISPLKVLSRGYSLVSGVEGVINSVNKVNVDDVVKITMSDGKVYACITRKDDSNGK
ncbi:MAG: exodeoxyribonuclease VII large subunit [Bacilli bacterium]|nr:exodeoxyribonuclease VII large subunit [Bacilli bacterium]